jgi:hypothetical protein
MSGINGDKARFHRDRKKKIAKRKRVRELLRPKSSTPGTGGEGMTRPVRELQ